MMKCQHIDCEYDATHLPRICVPIKDCSPDQIEPIVATVGIYLCLDHCKSFDTKDFVNPDEPQNLRDVFELLCSPRGLEPDFDRAFILPILMTSPDVEGFIKNASTHEPGHA